MVKQLIEHIVKNLVVAPEEVSVAIFHDGSRCSIEIRVAADDFKRVIGKDGAIIKALRSAAYALETEQKDIHINVVK